MPGPRRRAIALALLLTAALVAGGCSGDDESADAATEDASAPDPTAGGDATTSTTSGPVAEPPDGSDEWVYPGADWATVTPAEAGVDQDALDELVAYLESTGSNCMAVVKDGALVHEQYWNGTTPDTEQEIFSASKSVTATLVGIAQDLGHLDIDQKASDFITEWQGTESEDITIRNLLSNDSGRYYDFETDYFEMTTAPNRTEFAIALDQQHPIGEHWEYNNSAIQTLQAVLARSTGMSVNELAAEHLFGPLGMASEYSTDASGTEPTFMGVQSNCGDMARFGYLYQRDGWWDGEPVVSSDFVAEATRPSQDLNRAYGYLWWLNETGGLVPAVGTEPIESLYWPDAPEDAFAALGLGNQIVLVLPSQGLVITRTGPANRGDDPVPNTSVNEVGRLGAALVAE
jgi:CubicO group peptidase (beta-lactamase class C family)